MPLSSDLIEVLRCPVCQARLIPHQDGYRCTRPECAREYPVVDGIPILINETNSLFRLSDFCSKQETFYRQSRGAGVRRRLSGLVPDYSRNTRSAPNFVRLAQMLAERPGRPRILVLGGSVFNRGMEPLLDARFELIETDVSFGARTQAIVDAHDIPFADGTFDAVVAQAVFEHVLDPWRCVNECRRVLKPDGLIYAETPFLQPVHAGPYDFTRFTAMGHRYLFRDFDEVESGPVVGQAIVFAGSTVNFFRSLSSHRKLRSLLGVAATYLVSWAKYLDERVMRQPAAFDGAYGYFFLGRASTMRLDGRDLVKQYRGALSLLAPR